MIEILNLMFRAQRTPRYHQMTNTIRETFVTYNTYYAAEFSVARFA